MSHGRPGLEQDLPGLRRREDREAVIGNDSEKISTAFDEGAAIFRHK